MTNNRKYNRLMICQALLFGIIIIFCGFIVINEKIPSLKIKKVKEEINDYYKEHFNNLDVLKGNLKYNKNNNSYSITYYDKEYHDLNFTITLINNKIKDNYISNYIEGKSIIKDKEEKVLKVYKDIFNNTDYKNIKIKFKSLDKYNEEEKLNILNDNIYNTSYYSVSYTIKVDNFEQTYLNNLINSFINISSNNNLIANSYSITFDNNGIIKMVKVLKGGEIIYE